MCNNQLPEGFIPWHGGNNPVPGKRVRAKLRGGYLSPAGGGGEANKLRWTHYKDDADIIGYMVVEDDPAPATFSTKFKIGKEYKNRLGLGPFRLVAIVPEAEKPLVFLDCHTKAYCLRYSDGCVFAGPGTATGDMILPVRTVYVNILNTAGRAEWSPDAEVMRRAAERDGRVIAVAVPVEIEE